MFQVLFQVLMMQGSSTMKENLSWETYYQTKPKSRFLLYLKYLGFQDQVDKYGPLAIQALFSPINIF